MTELSYGTASGAPANWNILAAGTDQDALSPVADQVWLSAYSFGPDFEPILDKALLQGVDETSTNPQTLVYRINPNATWSDGVPVTGADFVFNWQAQSGRAGPVDAGGKPFTPQSTAGYGDVRSVTVASSAPDVVTVVFATPDPDWTELFRHLLPAHIAQGVGFDTGFTDPVADLVSDGPYVVASYDPSGVVHLVRNPAYAGSPAAALAFDVHYLPDPDQLVASVASGQISCADVPVTPGAVSQLRVAPNVVLDIGTGPSYVDLVFNSAGGAVASDRTREAITHSISRGPVISTALARVDPQAPPVGNRFLVPGESGYTLNGPPSPSVAGSAPTTTPAVPIRLVAASGDAVAASAAQAVAQQLESAGFAVQVQGVADPSTLPSATWDMALVVRQVTPWPTTAIKAYQTGQAENIGRISAPALDSAIQSALVAPASQERSLVDQIDESAWNAYADYPMFALPDVLACQTNVTGAAANASPDGPAYNAAGWGLRGGSS